MDGGGGGDSHHGSVRDTQRERDFLTLESADAYDQYFSHLTFVCRTVCRMYGDALTFELSVVRESFARLLELVKILHLKYGYQDAASRRLWIDLSHSGFPNCEEIKALEVDLAHRDARLAELPTMMALKRALVDHIMSFRADPLDILHKLAQRTYLEQLAVQNLFLSFNQAGLTVLGNDSDTGMRSYSFGWSCYDTATNRPYIHLMTFEQNADQPPLHEENSAREEFLAVMRQEGSRAPDVGVLALAIDDRLESVHPKIVKRICVGPLYSRSMSFALASEPIDPLEAEMRRVLAIPVGSSGADSNDFILFLTDEVIFSKRQEVSRSLFAPRGRVREIFYIPESNPDAYERRASVVHKYALLPHAVLQHISPADMAQMPHLSEVRRITYDTLGGIYGI